ncbi:MAG: cyclase family protein, partial [Eubacteriales bacterium]
GIKGVGIDGLGIERAQSDYATHRTLLGADIPIIEGLRLKDVAEGEYILVALPISIPEAEAAPVRAVLLEKGEVL